MLPTEANFDTVFQARVLHNPMSQLGTPVTEEIPMLEEGLD